MAQIGQHLPALTGATVSSGQLTTGQVLTLSEIRNLPAELSEAQLAAVEATARARLPELSPCDQTAFGAIIRTMRAALPMRAMDETSGKLLVATYYRMLGNWPREAISYLAERAVAECKWFPTIAECRDILADWERTDEPKRAKDAANGLIESRAARAERERFHEKEEFLRRLRAGAVTQAEVDAAPRWFVDIAECQGLLTRDGERFLLRVKLAA